MFILIVIACIGIAGLLYYLNSPSPYIPSEGRIFGVIKGESLNMIAARLEQEKLIRSSLFLKLLSRVSLSESSFKIGYFRILPGDSTIDIHNVLVAGYQEQVKVTIPEGWTVSRIVLYLEEKEIISKNEIIDFSVIEGLIRSFGIPAESLEGYLFPDTYFFPKGYPLYGVFERMVSNFFEHLREIVPEYQNWDKKDLHDKIIMASIVEREYRQADEAPLIASVFYNRLKYNIGLESCATLEYIITEIEKKPHPEYLTLEDKKIDSEYNTYKWAGLPPGPISNPGTVALKASFYPAETDYWYFLLKDSSTGEHYFSGNLEEHNQAKYHYLKGVKTGG